MKLLRLSNASGLDIPVNTLAVELPYGSLPLLLERLVKSVKDPKDFICVEWLSDKGYANGYYLEARFVPVKQSKKVEA